MHLYKLDYSIEKVLSQRLSREQQLLQTYGNQLFSKDEAGKLWEKINDHKWYVSERLQRDIGFRVATVDYLENFYEAPAKQNRKPKFFGSLTKIIRPAAIA